MKKNNKKRTFYLCTSEELGVHLEQSARRWSLTMNGYLNRLIREDFELELRKNSSFVERVNKKLSG